MTPSWKIARCSLQFFAVFAFFLEDPLLPISFGSSDRQHLLVNLLGSSEGLRGEVGKEGGEVKRSGEEGGRREGGNEGGKGNRGIKQHMNSC